MLGRMGSLWLTALAALLLPLGSAHGEWGTQTLELSPGWNAVFLEVQPFENKCEVVFGGHPVESIWMWNKRFDSVQFVQDPNNLVPENPDWLTWFRDDHPSAFLNDLYAVFSNRCYLVKLGGDAPVTVELEGRREVRKRDWLQDSFNFVGFHIDPASPPAFSDFFGADKALAGQEIYRTLPSGENALVENPETEQLRAGEAYWIYTKGPTTFSGPLNIEMKDQNGLVFGNVMREHNLTIHNSSNAPRDVTVRLLPSERPTKATKSLKSLAGPVALSYRRLVSWGEFDAPIDFTLAPGASQGLQLAVRRAAMQSNPDPDALYESVLEVRDDKGVRFLVPVSANGGVNFAGIWVGSVTLDGVSEAGNASDSVTTTPTGSPFTFRIIVHVDGDGNAHLLQRVSLMQVQAILGPSAEDPSVQEVVTPARYVAITDDSLLNQYEGISIRDGQLVGRRITAPAFGFQDPLPLSGTITTSLSGTTVMAYDDAMNPFVHAFHPDHNNLDERYDQTLPEGVESYTFSRELDLEFTEEDPEQLGLPEWGYEIIGGNYSEKLSGVHKRDIYMSGTFQLHKVLDVASLNDGN